MYFFCTNLIPKMPNSAREAPRKSPAAVVEHVELQVNELQNPEPEQLAVDNSLPNGSRVTSETNSSKDKIIGPFSMFLLFYAMIIVPVLKSLWAILVIIYDAAKDQQCHPHQTCASQEIVHTNYNDATEILFAVIFLITSIVHLFIGCIIFSSYPQMTRDHIKSPVNIFICCTAVEIVTMILAISSVTNLTARTIVPGIFIIVSELTGAAVLCYPSNAALEDVRKRLRQQRNKNILEIREPLLNRGNVVDEQNEALPNNVNCNPFVGNPVYLS